MQCYTIGHGSHRWSDFEDALRAHGVTLLVDVRSRPRSRFGRFNRGHLEWWLPAQGLRYLWLGEALGGRPADPALRTPDGGADYGRIRGEDAYWEAIQRLLELIRERPGGVCLMCAEEDPDRCHRHHLIEPDLVRLGVEVLHIRRRGRARPTVQRFLPFPAG